MRTRTVMVAMALLLAVAQGAEVLQPFIFNFVQKTQTTGQAVEAESKAPVPEPEVVAAAAEKLAAAIEKVTADVAPEADGAINEGTGTAEDAQVVENTATTVEPAAPAAWTDVAKSLIANLRNGSYAPVDMVSPPTRSIPSDITSPIPVVPMAVAPADATADGTAVAETEIKEMDTSTDDKLATDVCVVATSESTCSSLSPVCHWRENCFGHGSIECSTASREAVCAERPLCTWYETGACFTVPLAAATDSSADDAAPAPIPEPPVPAVTAEEAPVDEPDTAPPAASEPEEEEEENVVSTHPANVHHGHDGLDAEDQDPSVVGM